MGSLITCISHTPLTTRKKVNAESLSRKENLVKLCVLYAHTYGLRPLRFCVEILWVFALIIL